VSTSPQSAELSIPKLREELTGEVIARGDPAYDEARDVFLSGIDRRPAVIARVADADDVARVIALARESDHLELAVRSGAHSRAGYGTTEGGIVLDLSPMNALDIDAEGRTAWVDAGMKAGRYTHATGELGLVTGLGDTGSVGIGGITLGGGVGYLVRRNGLTIDDLLAAELVTADGERRVVDEESHPDLFWAIRGGGGNFGVVTRLKLRLHEIDEIVGGMLTLPATPETITGFVAAADAAPEGLSTIANVMLAPPMPFVPAEHHGKPVIMSEMAYAGPADEGERAIAPLRALDAAIVDMVRPMRYPDLYEGPGGPSPVFSAATNFFVDAIDRTAAETILDQLHASTAPMKAAQLRVLGGAMARLPSDATAFAHRDRRIMVNLAAMYENANEAATHEAWIAGFADAIRDDKPGAYVGFLGERTATIRAACRADLDRLAEIKGRYDPTNSSAQQNIPPAAWGRCPVGCPPRGARALSSRFDYSNALNGGADADHARPGVGAAQGRPRRRRGDRGRRSAGTPRRAARRIRGRGCAARPRRPPPRHGAGARTRSTARRRAIRSTCSTGSPPRRR
jgi:FAD/FMN-containing dehydrogenase